jgi:LysR family transcriptional regulator (chromosome initiation inhibitor)
VQGCTLRPLGAMRYLPVASPDFAAHWFAKDPVAALAEAPLVQYDEDDGLQHDLLRRLGIDARPPRHRVPGSGEFVVAVEQGYGWGMVPELQLSGGVAPFLDTAIDVPLYWHSWALGTRALERASEALFEAAARHLYLTPTPGASPAA